MMISSPSNKPTCEKLEQRVKDLESGLKNKRYVEEELRKSEERYRALFETMQDGVAVYEAKKNGEDFVFKNFNRAGELIDKVEKEDLIGESVVECFPGVKDFGLLNVFQRVWKTGKPHQYETQYITTEGETQYFDVRVAPVMGKDGNVSRLICNSNNVTDRKRDEEEKQRLQNQLQQSYKIKAIGTLAGGIAHKFNNSLSGITGNIELLKMANPDSKPIDKYADRMLDSARNMANLSNQLLAYAEGGKYQAKTLSLTDLIDSTLPIVNRKIASAIQVDTDTPVNIFNIKGDQTQIQMLLSAMIENAAEAIENEGRIKIMIRNEEVHEEFAKKHLGLKTGSYVCLRIIDDGKGMDEETKRRIFEPFFTTNFQGRGLGMAAAYGIVKNHDGWISVDSEPGKGTEVSIYLPAVDIRIEKPEEPKSEIYIGTGTILLIEDEEMVMDVGRGMIEKLGYSVLVAKCGKEAVNIAKTFNGNIDLALLDMGLPDIGGKELYPLLMEVCPKLKVIICSGYSIDGPARDILSAGAQAFIQKPFLFAELSSKIKQMIDCRKNKTT
jgi:two-component system cell cycle sensor histidine kinase/response regulator CckA